MSDSAKKARRAVAPFRFDEPVVAAPVPQGLPVSHEVSPLGEQRPRTVRPPSRQGKRNVNFVLSEPAWEQLSILSVRTRRPIQDLMQEATDLLFQSQGLSRIARE